MTSRISPTNQERKGKTATPAQKKNLKNARAAYSNVLTRTSKYTNRRNKLIDEVRKYIASYNKPKAALLTPSQPYLDPFSRKIGPNRKLLSTNLTPLKVSAY
ncbi:hypothetical protein HBH60_051090 [Parastagonospora nodorum]|nr:hypothetical protein HBI00_023300 [Parastagonospora nodorum]KAH4384239.1 hypothetical protein HBH94_050180 [Parastagonospora nodorum]KAH4594647.1 hypothetical protein HBH83_032700 [Parastagonospora nodorum]KAH4833206.1 hypothetical protein HBH60_051090 [Parastagonospora nodorum]